MVQLFPELLSVRLPRVNIVANIQHINDERSSAALAALLNGNTRRKPVVLITSPAGRTEPWIDVEDISQEAGALAEVYLMPTGSFTWEFSNRMADGTQVYGGAGRVYPVGHEWASDLTKSPLRFAFNEDDGRRATQQLISDMFRMASAAAVAWRASLQVNTPSARRIHYWVLPSGRVDLARVSTHDDFTI